MNLKKIRIENYKSIRDIEFELKKHGNSYTTMLVGINESGKSNILEAMSYLNVPKGEFDYNEIRNQNDESSAYASFRFFLEFEDKQEYINDIRQEIENGELLDFDIKNIQKIVYLDRGEKNLNYGLTYDINNLPKRLFIMNNKGTFTLSKEADAEGLFQELTEELFKTYFKEKVDDMIIRCEPEVVLWSPSDNDLVSRIDLHDFIKNINSNIPMRNIFYIAGYKSESEIKSKIDEINDTSLRKKLEGTLSGEITKYVTEIWNHKITFDIEIAEDGKCAVSVQDEGPENKYNFHEMRNRSDGFKRFMSLILSLSVDTKLSKKHHALILIDEPEAHLHPSGIRDLRRELLAIGEDNYLFVSTHSPFLIDRKDKTRNIIIKKSRSAETEKVMIDESADIIDDEVLREAFGIEVYKDLLNPHCVLVEGKSDKIILQKSFHLKGYKGHGIANGQGGNIDTLAAKLNDSDINILVILDDDKGGKLCSSKIIKMGGSYSKRNVFTIRDLVGEIIEGGTIEDTLGNAFLRRKLREVYESTFTDESFEDLAVLAEKSPFMERVRIYLSQRNKSREVISEFLGNLKIRISDDFKPSRAGLKEKHPLLDSLAEKIHSELSRKH